MVASAIRHKVNLRLLEVWFAFASLAPDSTRSAQRENLNCRTIVAPHFSLGYSLALLSYLHVCE